jgi:N-acetylmuramoyl-L-alanine amidase
MIGSKLVLIGTTKQVILSSAVERKYNTVIVPPDFLRKVFGREPSKIEEGQRPHLAGGKFLKVMIDAGHGGKDPGAMGVGGVIEKDIVFDIAQRLKSDLSAMGFQVLMTRDTDNFISLQERTAMATRQKADLFLSIHANATKSRKTRGLEIYYSRKIDKDTDLTQVKINE